ncbi:hypothetical protein [Rhizobium leguminosarum]|uniref:hypothetical protein n=1 Tax=Rhizobium leguminosarum TaxID=384 RepID=UPI00144277CB|nr:hypothetical protein [Rhizobium leguminosarum]NKL60074.1 hypothetical protein [Rhizobium leguminosarum bv. viciae]
MDHFKAEADIIRERLVERNSYVDKGHDPRRQFGGKPGDWKIAENRMYVLQNVIGLPLNRETYFRENGLRDAVAGLQLHSGAVCLRVDGAHKRVKGIAGHFAWFYPLQREYLPFIILLLARTSFPFSTIAGLRIGGYQFRAASIDVGIAKDRVLRFSAPKYRTVNDVKVEPEVISCVTITNSKSHVFSIIKFLEELTKPLRVELERQIELLSLQKNRDGEESEYLDHLIDIRSDLMIYHVGPKIFSLGTYSEVGSPPSEYNRALTLLGFPTDLSRLKSTNFVQGFMSFGEHNLLITLLGNHGKSGTSKPYRDRFVLYEAIDRRFIELFANSVALIKDGTFKKEALRTVLSEQGLSAEQIKILLSGETKTSWGNACCDPFNPPKEFDDRLDKSKPCKSQRCIDGCSNGRWFPDALKLVRTKLAELNRKIDTVPLAGMANSIIHHRIKRLLLVEKEIVKRRKNGANGSEIR